MSATSVRAPERPADDAWKKSTFSNPSGNCVEVAETSNGLVAVRNSREPEGAVIYYTRPEIDAFVRGAKAGEFDYLTA